MNATNPILKREVRFSLDNKPIILSQLETMLSRHGQDAVGIRTLLKRTIEKEHPSNQVRGEKWNIIYRFVGKDFQTEFEETDPLYVAQILAFRDNALYAEMQGKPAVNPKMLHECSEGLTNFKETEPFYAYGSDISKLVMDTLLRATMMQDLINKNKDQLSIEFNHVGSFGKKELSASGKWFRMYLDAPNGSGYTTGFQSKDYLLL